MHQTFYVDVDEEITSILERIKKAHLDELVVVVPKGALLIQSAINLKLLKKEADSLGKEIIIVTQDKAGKFLIEKTGIATEQRLEDIEGEKWENISEIKIEKETPYIPEESSPLNKKKNKKRLDKIGSSDFFENEEDKDKEDDYSYSTISQGGKKVIIEPKNNAIKDVQAENETILNRELVTDLKNNIKKGKSFLGKKTKNGPMDLTRSVNIAPKQDAFFEKEEFEYQGNEDMDQNLPKKEKILLKNRHKKIFQEDLIKEEKFEQFLNGSESFSNQRKFSENIERKPAISSSKVTLSPKFWKFFVSFSLLVGVFALGLFLFLFLPKAKVTIFLKAKTQSVDVEVKGDIKNTSIDSEGKNIPSKLISFSDELTKEFSSTGEKSTSNRKARGTLTIYNEYSSAPQPLVATTRFLTPDGKLFRLVSGITIPGMTKTGNESKPGAVEAEVVADETGESFNIDPSTFTIPGFQGSGNEKYSKFYAKSFSAMTGGGVGDAVSKAVNEKDINSAKEKILEEFNFAVKQKVIEQAGSGAVLLDDALNVSENNFKISNSVGDVSDTFSVTLTAKINAVVFKEEDLKNVIKNIMDESSEDGLKISEKTIIIDFGKSDTNMTDGTILIRAHSNGKSESNIDLENLKKGLLGKKNEELKAYLVTFSEFSDVEIEYWPSFVSEKIPIYESRVEVVLDNN